MKKFILLFLFIINCSNLQKRDERIINIPIRTPLDIIKIASFNIQIFGKSKASKQQILRKLAIIITNFDIVAIQEIRDKSGTSTSKLLREINLISTNDFSCIESRRLGRSKSKEQYAFLFNNKVKYSHISYVYNDKNDVFEREPFIANFSAKKFDFTLVNIHIKPTDAKNEIQALEQVIMDINLTSTNNKDIIILGDLNADGSYFSENITNGLRDKKYLWIIPDNINTTVAKSDNTYDRIIIILDYTYEDYANKFGVYRFDKTFTNIEPKKISDHYPIWAEFYIFLDSD